MNNAATPHSILNHIDVLKTARNKCLNDILECNCKDWSQFDISMPPDFDIDPCSVMLKDVPVPFLSDLPYGRHNVTTEYENNTPFKQLITVEDFDVCIHAPWRRDGCYPFDISKKSEIVKITEEQWKDIVTKRKDYARRSFRNDSGKIFLPFGQVNKVSQVKVFFPQIHILNEQNPNNPNEYILKPKEKLVIEYNLPYPQSKINNIWEVNHFIALHHLISNKQSTRNKLIIKVKHTN